MIGVVADSTCGPGVKLYTDESAVYNGLENQEAVNHSVGKYVDGREVRRRSGAHERPGVVLEHDEPRVSRDLPPD